MMSFVLSLRKFNLFMITVTCLTGVADAQLLCSETLNGKTTESSTRPPPSMDLLKEAGQFVPILEKSSGEKVLFDRVSERVEMRREFPFLFTDLIFAEKTSVFQKQLIEKIQRNQDIMECWADPKRDCSNFNLRAPQRKYHFVDTVRGPRELSFDAEHNLPKVRTVSMIVPGRRMFSTAEVHSLALLYRRIKSTFTVEQLSTVSQDGSPIDKEIAQFAMDRSPGGERAFLEHFTLKSMHSIGYVENDPAEILPEISAFYGTNPRQRDL